MRRCALPSLLALLLALPAPGSALRCYSCLTKRSDRDSCSDPYRPAEHHARDCPPKYRDPVCFKVVAHNDADPHLGPEVFSRGCVPAANYNRVTENAREADGVRVRHVSRCHTDLCNV